MMSNEYLDQVNYALGALTREQLDNGMDAQDAWQQRRDMLLAVEQHWSLICEDLAPEVKEDEVAENLESAISHRIQKPRRGAWIARLTSDQRLLFVLVLLLLGLFTFVYVMLL
jgi:hypothetical protein